MIAYIKGRLLEVAQRSCVVVTASGLGYEVFLTDSELGRLPARGEQVAFHVVTIVREDAITLYGFSDFDQSRFFSVLLSVPKLGPRTSLALLNFFTPDALLGVVNREDVRSLSQVPGIGAKSAARIVLDLKDKLRGLNVRSGSASSASQTSAHQEVLAVLTGLGYSPAEVAGEIEKVFNEDTTLDTTSAVRLVLKELARQKS